MIRQALSWAKGVPEFKEPKAHSQRTIPLPASLVATLRRHEIAQRKERLRSGPDYRAGLDLVFATEIGTPLDARKLVQRHFKRIVREAGLPSELRLYDLRHSHATALMAAGVHAKVAAERFGHATTRQTLDTYSHVLPGMQEEATLRIEESLF
jgi:integrase